MYKCKSSNFDNNKKPKKDQIQLNKLWIPLRREHNRHWFACYNGRPWWTCPQLHTQISPNAPSETSPLELSPKTKKQKTHMKWSHFYHYSLFGSSESVGKGNEMVKVPKTLNPNKFVFNKK